jgi:hypothetical protein
MRITNHTPFCLGVNSKEFVGFIQPESSLEVPDDVGDWWLLKDTLATLLGRGLLTVDRGVPVIVDAPTSTKRPHWRRAIKEVEVMDLDSLMDLHATETRPKVLEAIETRMEKLNAETFAGSD